MINKLYIDTSSTYEKDFENLDIYDDKTAIRKIIDYFFAVIGGCKKGTPTVVASVGMSQANALVRYTDIPGNGGTFTISSFDNTGKLADVVLTVDNSINGATGLAIGSLGASGMSAGNASAHMAATLAASVNLQAALSGVVGATVPTGGDVLVTASEYGYVGNGFSAVDAQTNCSVIYNFGSTGIGIGTKGTDYSFSF